MQLKRAVYRFIPMLVCGLLLCSLNLAQASDAGTRKVLLLHSYEPGNPWTDRLHEHLLKALQVASFPVEITTEYLGTKRNDPQSLYPHLANLLEARQLEKPDVLMITDNNALEFAQQYRNRLFAGVPIVFAGINPLRDAWRHRDPEMTGVLESSDPQANLNLVDTLFPRTRKLVFITDQTRTGQIEKIRFERAISGHKHNYQVEFYEDWTLQSLKQRLHQADKQTLFFLISAFRDRNNLQISLHDAVKLLLNNSQVPVLSAWPAGLEAGLLGGVMTTAELQAQAAARMALDILRGRSLRQMPVALTSPAIPMFNYTQLHRFGIDPQLLPAGSKVWGRPPAWYESDVPSLYAWPICLTLGAMLILLLLLWLREQRRTHQTRHELMRSEDELQRLRHFFNELPAPACFTNSQGQVSALNRRFARLALTDETGQPLTSYQRHAPELAQALAGQSPVALPDESNAQAVQLDYTDFWLGQEQTELHQLRRLSATETALLPLLQSDAALRDVLLQMLGQLAAAYPGLSCAVQSYHAERDKLSLLVSAGLPQAYREALLEVPAGQGFGSAGAALAKRRRVIAEDISQHTGWQNCRDTALQSGLHACWAEPLICQGEPAGVLSFYFEQPRAADSELLSLLEFCGRLCAILLDQHHIRADWRKLSAALEQSPCMVMITDTQGVIEYVNGLFCAVTGYSREEACGHKPGMLSCPETPRSLYDNLWQSILSGLDWQGELFNRTKSGQQIRCSLSVSPLFNEQGEITHFIAVSQDISAQYRARQSINPTGIKNLES